MLAWLFSRRVASVPTVAETYRAKSRTWHYSALFHWLIHGLLKYGLIRIVFFCWWRDHSEPQRDFNLPKYEVKQVELQLPPVGANTQWRGHLLFLVIGGGRWITVQKDKRAPVQTWIPFSPILFKMTSRNRGLWMGTWLCTSKPLQLVREETFLASSWMRGN